MSLIEFLGLDFTLEDLQTYMKDHFKKDSSFIRFLDELATKIRLGTSQADCYNCGSVGSCIAKGAE